MEDYTLITVLGWEERFPLGMKIILDKYDIRRIILISYLDYTSMNKVDENRAAILRQAEEKKIEIKNLELEYSNSVTNWKVLDDFFKEESIKEKYLLNITTIPRETIWTLLFFLKDKVSHIDYIYFKPKEYCDDWLTKNYKNPRLLFKHSGVFELDKKLVLFIITGFDSSRLNSLIEFYEPHKIVIFSQKGNQFNNMDRNNRIKINESYDYEKVEFDSYDVQTATTVLATKVKEYEDYNIIISSQGPKLSSLSTYMNYLTNEKIALAYVPARDFNNKYSTGIDSNYITGKFKF